MLCQVKCVLVMVTNGILKFIVENMGPLFSVIQKAQVLRFWGFYSIRLIHLSHALMVTNGILKFIVENMGPLFRSFRKHKFSGFGGFIIYVWLKNMIVTYNLS